MPVQNIIVIGASAGGFEALKTIAGGLPADLDAAVFIVWHMSPDVRGILPDVLDRAGPLPASHALDHECIEKGHIYIAPPDRHMLVENGAVRVTRGPRENRFRPAVDPLFRSAAYHYGPRVIGAVLSGALDDGTSGLWTVKYRGGTAVVQDPLDAEVPSMPQNALREVDVDHVVSAKEMPALFAEIIARSSESPGEAVMNIDENETEKTKREIQIAAEDNALDHGLMQMGELPPFNCPECHGVLSSLRDGTLSRFRCHTGHAFSADVLLAAVTENIEDSLWSAVRGMDETIMMLNHFGDHFAEQNEKRLAALYFQKANEARSRSEIVRQAVMTHEQLTGEGLRHEAAAGPHGNGADRR